MAFKIGDVQVSAFGSRAHLEEKALATVKFYKILDRHTDACTYACNMCLGCMC